MQGFCCRRLRLCSYLKERGFLPQSVHPDPDNPKYNLYYYRRTPEFEKALHKYFTQDCYTAQNQMEADHAGNA